MRQINRTNKRQRAGGYYLEQAGLCLSIDVAYEDALDQASLEAFGGVYDAFQLAELADEDQIKAEALQLILDAQ